MFKTTSTGLSIILQSLIDAPDEDKVSGSNN